MNRSPLGSMKSAQETFSESFAFLVAARGLRAEQELLELLGPLRLSELYEDGEPLFSELIEISRILRVPFSTFVVTEPGGFDELEIAYAELLYHAAQMTREARADLGRQLTSIAKRLAAEADGASGAPAEESDAQRRRRRS